jgi:FkbM family methyltransferase
MLTARRLLIDRMPGLYFHLRNVGRKVVGTRRNQRQLFRDLLRPGDLVFDVGANIGEYTGAFIDLGATVVAVEPQPQLAEHLRRRFHTDRRVTVVHTALSDHQGTATLYCPTADALATLEEGRATGESGPGAKFRWSKTLTVPLSTIDALVGDFGTPALIKIDVEGHELNVLQGMADARPSIFFEINRPAVYDVMTHLEERGYSEFFVRRDERSAWVFDSAMSALKLREYLSSSAENADVLALSPEPNTGRPILRQR